MEGEKAVDEQLRLQRVYAAGLVQQTHTYLHHQRHHYQQNQQNQHPEPTDQILEQDLTELKQEWDQLGESISQVGNWPKSRYSITSKPSSAAPGRTDVTCSQKQSPSNKNTLPFVHRFNNKDTNVELQKQSQTTTKHPSANNKNKKPPVEEEWKPTFDANKKESNYFIPIVEKEKAELEFSKEKSDFESDSSANTVSEDSPGKGLDGYEQKKDLENQRVQEELYRQIEWDSDGSSSTIEGDHLTSRGSDTSISLPCGPPYQLYSHLRSSPSDAVDCHCNCGLNPPHRVSAHSMASYSASCGSSSTGSSTRASPQPYHQRPGTRASPVNLTEESPTSKRRRMSPGIGEPDTAGSSRSASPPDSLINLAIMGESSFSSQSGEQHWASQSFDSSNVSTPLDSPMSTICRAPRDFRGRYKKDELWAAIQSDYQYLMDDEIIETCKSTESDLSWESDDPVINNSRVSFTEFMQQFKELTDWLSHIQLMTLRHSSSLSEKYLNQTYHEEMLQSSPRRRLFNEYAKQLVRRYPQMKEEINSRLHVLNGQWTSLEKAISPVNGYQDARTMLKDLEDDLAGLKKWLGGVEQQLQVDCVPPGWTKQQLQQRLQEHKGVQKDIESHSKIVSAVLKLCERLQVDDRARTCQADKDNLRLGATTLEHRWHVVLLQSLEWQYRLEEAIATGKVPPLRRFDDDNVSNTWSEASFTSADTDGSYLEYLPTKDERYQSEEYLRDDSLESDNSTNDIIPFYADEYEKITVDTDTQTDGGEGRITPDSGAEKGSPTKTSYDSMDKGIDSALGRSVSDQSIEAERQAKYHSTLTLSSDNIGNVVRASYSQGAIDMRAAQELNRSPTTEQQPHKVTLKTESHDVGYSSESHSNDEPDGLSLPSPSEVVIIEEAVEPASVVLRRKFPENKKRDDGASATEGGLSPQGAPYDPTWRHSMTSAYDTSSNCSDLHSPHELDQADNGEDVGTDEENVVGLGEPAQSIMRSPSQNFYCMTTIETDSEATSTTSRVHPGDITTTDVESELSRSMDNADDINSMKYNLDHDANTVNTINAQNLAQNGHRHTHKTSRPDSLALSGMLNKNKLNSEFVHANGHSSMDHQEHYKGSKESSQVQRRLDINYSKQTTRTVIDDSVTELVNQKDIVNGEKESRKRKHRSRRGIHVPTKSYNSIERPVEESHASSCDASSEQTFSGTESESDLSRLSSTDDKAACHSSALSSHSSSSPCTCKDNTCCNCKNSSRKSPNSSHHRLRHDSVTELYQLSHRLDLTPFSISESAIDYLQKPSKNSSTCSVGLDASIDQQMKRATSEASPLGFRRQNSPRRTRRYKVKRSSSDDNTSGAGVEEPLLHSTPYMKRKSFTSSTEDQVSAPHQSPSDVNKELQSLTTSLHQADIEATRRQDAGTADLILPVSMVKLDSDTDHHLPSLNTTVDSEQSWDNYQALPYGSISEDTGEEKLDPSKLQGEWEHSQDYEEDFSFPSLPAADHARTRGTMFARNAVEDSDSDLEDFEYCIRDSQKAIAFTEGTLTRVKDPMDTGLYMDPSEYNDPLATCQTNIKCLKVIIETLEQERGLTNVTERDIENVRELIDQWHSMEVLARLRQTQSMALSPVYDHIQVTQKTLADILQTLETPQSFDSVKNLEFTIASRQKNRMELSQKVMPQMAELNRCLNSIHREHPNISLDRFRQEINGLETQVESTMDKCKTQLCELQPYLIAWYDFNETHKELSYLLQRQSAGSTSSMAASRSTEEDVTAVADLECVHQDFGMLELKLQSLRHHYDDMSAVTSDLAQMCMKGQIHRLDGDITQQRQHCQEIMIQIQAAQAAAQAEAQAVAEAAKAQQLREEEKMEEDLVEEDLGVEVDKEMVEEVEGATALPEVETHPSMEVENLKAETTAVPKKKKEARSLLKLLLRAGITMPIALILVLGLLYMWDPSCTNYLMNFGLVIDPQLRYIKGPPPT